MIAEDGALFRDGLLMLLSAAGHEVSASTTSGDDLFRALSTDPPDVAILDIRMPPEPLGGITTARRIRAERPEVGILLLSHHAETDYLRQMLAIDSQRIGYRLKDKVADVGALTSTLQRIGDGELVIEPVLAARLVDRAQKSNPTTLTTLTEREREVLALMAEGRSNSGIAGELYVSVKSVERYIANVFGKLALPGDVTTHHRRVLAVLTYLREQHRM